jgi:hypothetical protein
LYETHIGNLNGHSVYLLTFELEKVKSISRTFKKAIKFRPWLMPQPITSRTLLVFIGRSDMDVFLVIVLGGLGIFMIMQLVGYLVT